MLNNTIRIGEYAQTQQYTRKQNSINPKIDDIQKLFNYLLRHEKYEGLSRMST
jgi:hypothetical protein